MTAGNVPNVEVVLTNHVTTVEGRVTDRAGRPTSIATLIVFSREPQFWTAVSRRVRVLRPRSDGSYSTSGLPPGDYLVYATTTVPLGQRVDDVSLAAAASRATPVRLVDDQVVRQDVAVGDWR